MSEELIGLPAPPPVGATALPAAHVRRRVRRRDRRRHRAGQGDRRRVRATGRVDGDREPQARAPRGRATRRWPPSAHRYSPLRATSAMREQIARRVRRGRGALRAPGRAREQRRRELSRPRRGHVAERVAHRRRHHAERNVLVLSRVRPPPHRGALARARSSTSARPTRGRADPDSCTRPRRRPA